MNSQTLFAFVACVSLSLACASSGAQQHGGEGPFSGDDKTLSAPEHTRAGVPASAQALSRRMAARHVEDLPTAEELKAISDAEASLIWIANNADTMIARVRALGLLRHFPSDRALAVLLTCATDPSLHPTLHAGALRGLQAHTGKAPVLNLLTLALRSKDPRVANAAAESLAVDPRHASILKAAAADPAVNEALRLKLGEGAL